MRQRWHLGSPLGALCAALLLCLAAEAANYRLGRHYGGDFTLTDQDGRRFSLRDARGKVVLLHFGFTSCAGVCPTTMAKVAAALERLGARAARVQPILVSVDTKRDTPPILREYVRSFHPSYLALTGTQQEVEAVARQYRAPLHVHKPDQSGFYVVDHASSLYLIGADGMLADLLLFDLPVEKIAERIGGLLDEQPNRGSVQ
jgi:protein SCO1/2